jgi:DNA-binding response OmpR family regulator
MGRATQRVAAPGRLKVWIEKCRYSAMNVVTAPVHSDRRQSARVLWADDDPMIRTVMATNLEAEGFDVQTVADGDAAYEATVRIHPDVLVLDIMMPGRDGYAVLRDLRSNPETAEVPVVLLSAKATDAEVWEGWKAGADYYITKPFDPTELTDFIEHLLAKPSPDDASSPSLGAEA